MVKNYKKKIIKKYKVKSKKVIFLPFGYDQFLIKKRKNQKIKNQILFYGAWDKNRENILSKIDSKYLKIYGNGWDNAHESFKKKFNINKHIFGKKLVEEISNSLTCLNLFRDQAKNFINMRTFEVIGYGGNLLSEYSSEQIKFFKKYSNLKHFKDINDINNIYKNFFLKRKKLFKSNKKNIIKMRKHDYLHRAKFILSNEKIHINK